MPPPININNVPLNYFLHGVDAMRDVQNVQPPGSAGVQPADNGIEGGPQAPKPGSAAKMVQQLDILLVKAAKASTKSLDGKTIKTSLERLVTDGVLDKNSLKLLAKTADTAASTLKALDKFTGAQLAAAVKSASREPHSCAEIDQTSKAGKAIKAAADAQYALSDMLAQLHRQLGAMERNDAKMREANPGYRGVDAKLHNEVVELRSLCDRRATEIDALAFQMHDFAVHQAAQGENADPNVAAILKAKVNDLLPRQALAMHGTADALATVNSEISGKLRPPAERIDAFKSKPDSVVAGDDFLALQSDIRTMKEAVADIRENGIQVGGGRMVVSKDILKALEKEVKQAEALFETARQDVKKRMLDNSISTALKLFGMKESDERKALVDSGNAAVKLFNERDEFINSLVRIRDAVLAPKPDLATANSACDKARVAADKLLDATYDIHIPAGENGVALTKFIGTAQAAHTVVVNFISLANNILASERLFTGNEAMSVFKGSLSVSSVVESRARGLRTGDVDPANEDSNIESSRLLGAGAAGTVYLLRRRDGAEVVFKGEMESRTGLNTICAGKGAAYRKAQKAVNLNIASKCAADALGCGELIVNYKAGTHNGVFGFFMDKAKGRSAQAVVDKGGPKTGDAGLTGSEIASLPPAERSKVKGEIMRQLNRLQWLDIVTGQMDRHSENYFIHVDRATHKVTVTGIDNDACFSKYLTGVGTFTLDKERGKRFQSLLVKVLKDAGVRKADDVAKRLVDADPSITRQGDRITVNTSKVTNRAILAAMKELTGVQSTALPDRIDRELYTRLMELKNNPAARREYLDSLGRRMDKENVDAAETRLNDAIAHAERLAADNKVVDGDDWKDETTPRREPDKVEIELPDGKHKRLSRQASHDVSGMTCQSYFARDNIDGLFT